MAFHICSAQAIALQTPRGEQLEVIATFPPGQGPFPALILAPGSGYHMTLPILEEVAKQLAERGVAVYRFNWAYFSKDPKAGRPSENLTREIEDMTTVLNHARRETRVVASRIFVGGKSLGTGVSWSLLASNKDLRGALLLTPVCSSLKDGTVVTEADENYPGINAEKRPISFILGDQDPLCSVGVLYRFAASAAGPVRVSVLSGNHGLEDPALSSSAKDVAKLRSARLAGALAAEFVAQYAQQNAP